MTIRTACPVCTGLCEPLPAVDFNKTCGVAGSKALAPAGMPVTYVLCTQCAFCHAPEIAAWSLEQFEDRIYNDDYAAFDPDYVATRPTSSAAKLHARFGRHRHTIRHLDYGGGSGLLSQCLRQDGWDSSSYDPFVDRTVTPGQFGQFNLITAYEVFEHVPDPGQLMAALRTLLAPGGIILFSTLVSDGKLAAGQAPAWWYAAPRNGHISLFSRHSLAILAHDSGFSFASFDGGSHAYFTQLPAWASDLLGPAAVAPPDAAPQRGMLARWLVRLVERLLARRK